MRKTVIGGHPMKKLLILCVLLLAALLSGCAAEPLQGQTTGNTPKAPTPQKETPASFEPVSTEPNAPTVAVDPADSMPNEDKHESGPAISSEPVSAPTESNAPASEEAVPFPVSWTVKMKKKQKETQDILSYHTQAAGCSDKARAKASGGRQPIEECGRTGL